MGKEKRPLYEEKTCLICLEEINEGFAVNCCDRDNKEKIKDEAIIDNIDNIDNKNNTFNSNISSICFTINNKNLSIKEKKNTKNANDSIIKKIKTTHNEENKLLTN